MSYFLFFVKMHPSLVTFIENITYAEAKQKNQISRKIVTIRSADLGILGDEGGSEPKKTELLTHLF